MKISYCVIKHNSFLPYVYHNNNHVFHWPATIAVFKSPSFHVVEKNVPLVFFENRINGKEGDKLKILISQRAGIWNLPLQKLGLTVVRVLSRDLRAQLGQFAKLRCKAGRYFVTWYCVYWLFCLFWWYYSLSVDIQVWRTKTR